MRIFTTESFTRIINQSPNPLFKKILKTLHSTSEKKVISHGYFWRRRDVHRNDIRPKENIRSLNMLVAANFP